MKKHIMVFLTVLLLGAAFPLFAGGTRDGRESTLVVAAEGIVTRTPDTAVVQLGVETRSPQVKDAFASNQEAMNNLQKVVLGFGIKESDITTVNYSVYYEELYNSDPQVQKREGFYRVSNGISVTIRDGEKIGALIAAAVEAGANQLWGLNFHVSDRRDAEDEALRLAIRNAEAKAKVLADAAGVRLGKAVSVIESGAEYPGPMNMKILNLQNSSLSGGSGQVAPGKAEIRSAVQVVFSIE